MTTRNRKRTAAMVVAGLAVGVTAASAAIVNTQGDAVQFTPASVVLGATQSNINFAAFDERQCFQLSQDLDVDEGTIAAGTWVSCEFNHADPVAAAGANFQGRVLYDNPILGVISTSAGLDDSDVECEDGVIYPAAGTELNRGMEIGVQADNYQIIAGGFGIALRFEVPSFSDQARVIIACPGGD